MGRGVAEPQEETMPEGHGQASEEKTMGEGHGQASEEKTMGGCVAEPQRKP